MAGREGGITYEQVAAAADALLGKGENATVRAVRAAIGGSPNTILRHLQVWREHRPAPVAAVVRDMPAVMVRAYQEEAARIAAEARSQIEAQLVEAQTESADLARAADEFERERDTLVEQVAALGRERDTLTGKEAVQLAELEQLRTEVERERRAAEEARIAVAQQRHASESHTRQLDAQKEEIERLRLELKHEHESRIEAQREQAALGAAKAALVERLAEVQARERAAADEAERLRARVEALVGAERTCASDLTRVRKELARSKEERTRLSEERKQARSALDDARHEAQQHQNALEQMRAKLSAAEAAATELAETRKELTLTRQEVNAARLENARLSGQLEALRRPLAAAEVGEAALSSDASDESDR